MKKAKTLNELYLILWERIKDKTCIQGLCAEIFDLWKENLIDVEDYQRLKKHFKSERPTRSINTEFFTTERRFTGGVWWWDSSEDHNPINRKAFIQKMIKITK